MCGRLRLDSVKKRRRQANLSVVMQNQSARRLPLEVYGAARFKWTPMPDAVSSSEILDRLIEDIIHRLPGGSS
jgi:hypothetical protein